MRFKIAFPNKAPQGIECEIALFEKEIPSIVTPIFSTDIITNRYFNKIEFIGNGRWYIKYDNDFYYFDFCKIIVTGVYKNTDLSPFLNIWLLGVKSFLNVLDYDYRLLFLTKTIESLKTKFELNLLEERDFFINQRYLKWLKIQRQFTLDNKALIKDSTNIKILKELDLIKVGNSSNNYLKYLYETVKWNGILEKNQVDFLLTTPAKITKSFKLTFNWISFGNRDEELKELAADLKSIGFLDIDLVNEIDNFIAMFSGNDLVEVHPIKYTLLYKKGELSKRSLVFFFFKLNEVGRLSAYDVDPYKGFYKRLENWFCDPNNNPLINFRGSKPKNKPTLGDEILKIVNKFRIKKI